MGALLLDLYRSRLRVVAGCGGHAVAAGAMLLLVSDLRIASRRPCKIGFSEMSIGLALPALPIALARERLARRHWPRATLLGQLYAPEGALAVGFLDSVVEEGDLEEEALVAARSLAALDDSAYTETLHRVRGPTIAEIETVLELERRQ